MNYMKLYISICRNAEKRIDKPANNEKHHVFPVSLFGDNNRIVELSYREHYIVHLLLMKACLKRYGKNHQKTRKMAMAVHKMVFGTVPTRLSYVKTSRMYNVARIAVKLAKTGKAREDMKGKAYFGASPDSVQLGIQKMVKKKTGMKIKYPKNRKSAPRSTETIEKIKQTKKFTQFKYTEMSHAEFLTWVKSHNLYMKDGRMNGNITRAILARNENIGDYYD